MTDNHPITPPPALVEHWIAQIWHEGTPVRVAASDLHVATLAARWGADQELEACCKWQDTFNYPNASNLLRAARRPKPPTLAEQALDAIDEEHLDIRIVNYKVIRAALERLQELEGNG